MRMWHVSVDVHLDLDIEAEDEDEAEDIGWEEFLDSQGWWTTDVWAEPYEDDEYPDEPELN